MMSCVVVLAEAVGQTFSELMKNYTHRNAHTHTLMVHTHTHPSSFLLTTTVNSFSVLGAGWQIQGLTHGGKPWVSDPHSPALVIAFLEGFKLRLVKMDGTGKYEAR